jgi:bisphosphoglycerate-independent phosphoglycerate mutase (AlkP superfamily)
VAGADQVWLIAFGNGVAPKGEVSARSQVYTNQIAATVLEILNSESDESMGGALNLMK